MASRFKSVTSEEIPQINDEAVAESAKKPTKFGLAVFEGNGFVYKCKLNLRNLTCSRENQS